MILHSIIRRSGVMEFIVQGCLTKWGANRLARWFKVLLRQALYFPNSCEIELTLWDKSTEGHMPKPTGPRSRWVLTEAAKHATPESMRRRIAYAQRQLLDLTILGSGRDMERAREAHQQLIEVPSDRLASHMHTNRTANFR
jgi:hypothetical protein